MLIHNIYKTMYNNKMLTRLRLFIDSIEVLITFPKYYIVRIDNFKRFKIVEIYVFLHTKAKNDDSELKTQK